MGVHWITQFWPTLGRWVQIKFKVQVPARWLCCDIQRAAHKSLPGKLIDDCSCGCKHAQIYKPKNMQNTHRPNKRRMPEPRPLVLEEGWVYCRWRDLESQEAETISLQRSHLMSETTALISVEDARHQQTVFARNVHKSLHLSFKRCVGAKQ